VKLGKYVEADSYKVKADALELLEEQRRSAENQNTLTRKMTNIDKKLELELKSAEYRLRTQ